LDSAVFTPDVIGMSSGFPSPDRTTLNTTTVSTPTPPNNEAYYVIVPRLALVAFALVNNSSSLGPAQRKNVISSRWVSVILALLATDAQDLPVKLGIKKVLKTVSVCETLICPVFLYSISSLWESGDEIDCSANVLLIFVLLPGQLLP
jgi:hypothetical protein